MAGKNVDTEALGKAASALGTYIANVQNSIQKMKDAATDCSDNMGSDVYSQRAIEKLQDCSKALNKTITEAESLRKTILKKKQQIQDSANRF
jgi:predicted RNase H-like nuclease (RuvC/YqgF family)